MPLFDMTQLFEQVGILAPHLLTRESGEDAFPLLEAALLAVPLGGTLILDFRHIKVMDVSFADATVMHLLRGLVGNQYGDRFLVVKDPSSSVLVNLKAALARQRPRLALLVQEQGSMHVIEEIEPNLAEAWELTRRAGTLTARALADHLNLEINTASMRLHKLYRARLLSRHEEVTPAGRQHIYRVPA